MTLFKFSKINRQLFFEIIANIYSSNYFILVKSYLQRDNDFDTFISKFNNKIILQGKTVDWPGTSVLVSDNFEGYDFFKIKMDEESFSTLEKFAWEFIKVGSSIDFSLYDEQDNLILCTTAHENDLMIMNEYISKINIDLSEHEKI